MSARDEVLRTIKAAQDDRKAANAAGDGNAVEQIFVHIVTPLNQQFARMALDPMPDSAEIRLASQTVDAGMATCRNNGVADARMVNTAARADALRGQANDTPPPPSVNPDIPDTPPVPIQDTPDPVPPGDPTTFVSARKSANKQITYIDAEGREVLRIGGSRSWRNFNPGNIRMGSFAEMSGSIGDDGAFAIFPDEPTGRDAIVGLLQSNSYRNLSLKDAIFRYAPPVENDSAAYVAFIESETGIDRAKILKDLPVAQIRTIAKFIKQVEGWTPGEERPNAPSSLASANAGGVSAAAGAAGEWMGIAEREAALPEHERSEWPDPGENPRILEYFRIAASWFDPGDGDETDWCAAFVNYCLLTSGHIGTDHPGARSFFWNKKNQFIPLSGPTKNAIAVRRYAPFGDATWASGPGHVGFVSSFTSTHVTLLGGNQGNTVKLKQFPLETFDDNGNLASKFVAFMMPVIS